MTARPHHIHPRDWARMSWHQQARAHRAWVKALDAEYCPPRVEPVVVGPYSRLDATPPVRGLRLIIAILAHELEQTQAQHVAPHGTRSARERHYRRHEPLCAACKATYNPVPSPVTPDEVEQMHELRAQGLTHRQIADRIGRGHTTVKVHLRKTDQEAAA